MSAVEADSAFLAEVRRRVDERYRAVTENLGYEGPETWDRHTAGEDAVEYIAVAAAFEAAARGVGADVHNVAAVWNGTGWAVCNPSPVATTAADLIEGASKW